MKRREKMIVGGIILTLIGLIFVYWNISYSPYKHQFTKQMEEKVSQVPSVTEVCTDEEIDQLPEPLKRYCDYIGLKNFPKYQVVRTTFMNTDFVFDDKSGKVLDMDYDLWLVFNQPFRSAYCSSSIYGIPFDGIDYCTQNQEGGMKGIIGKAIQIFDVHSKQGYQAGLISWFAEALILNPSVVLSPYVTYEVMDANQVKVTVACNGVSGSGLIFIDDQGVVTSFYSDERQVENIDGVETRIGWKCEYEDYRMENGIMQAHTVRSIKIYPDKEVTYFESDDFKIEYRK